MPSHPELARRFIEFADYITRGETPLYRALAWRCAANPAILARIAALPKPQQSPYLFFTAVHYLLLAEPAHPLGAYFGTSGKRIDGDPALWLTFADFVSSRGDELDDLMRTRSIQLNDVGRAALLRIALATLPPDEPLALIEFGASAGLNLLLDRFHVTVGDVELGDPGSPVRVRCAISGSSDTDLRRPLPTIIDRVGIDRALRDVNVPDDMRWLQAAIWPEARHRVDLFRAAVGLARLAPPRLVAGGAAELPDLVADLSRRDARTCVFHSATLGWMTPAQQREFARTLHELSRVRALTWISLEGPAVSPVAGLVSDEEAVARGRPFLLGVTRLAHGTAEHRLLGFAGVHGEALEWCSRHDEAHGAHRY